MPHMASATQAMTHSWHIYTISYIALGKIIKGTHLRIRVFRVSCFEKYKWYSSPPIKENKDNIETARQVLNSGDHEKHFNIFLLNLIIFC